MTGVTAGAMGFIGAACVIAGLAALPPRAAFLLAGFFAALRAGFFFFAAFFFPAFFFPAFFLDAFLLEDFLDDFFFATRRFAARFLDFFALFFFEDFFFAAFFFAAMFNSFQWWTDCLSCAGPVAPFNRTTKLSIRIERRLVSRF